MDKLRGTIGFVLLAFVVVGYRDSLAADSLSVATTSGTQWLQSRIQADGSVANADGIANDLQANSETLNALAALNAVGDTSTLTLGLIISGSYKNTENLSREVIAAAELGESTASLTSLLQANQNPDGGFAELAGYQSTSFDSAYALQALDAAGQGDSDAARQAATYLVHHEAADGSWSDWQGVDVPYGTALVIQALSPFRARLTGIGAAISSGIDYLKSKRQPGDDWGEVFINAQIVLALAAAYADPSFVADTASDLGNAQLVNGSWNDDVFTTSLALRALAAARREAPSTQSRGSVEGYVVAAGAGRPIAGARVFPASNSDIGTTTNGDGYYNLDNLTAGPLTLVANASGYSAATTVATVFMNATTDASKLVLAPDGNTGMVLGTIISEQEGTPVSGGIVRLSGSSQYSATADAKGAFAIANVVPDDYTLHITAAGYITASGMVTVVGGDQYRIDQALLLNGTYQDDSPVAVTATLVDGVSGAPVPNAQILLNTSISGTAASDGSVSLSNVPLGSYQATVSAPGYATAYYDFVLVPGTNGQLGTLRLYALTGASAASTLTVLGKVVSGLGNQAIAGAVITRTDTGESWTSDSDGNFTISNLSDLSVTLQIAASGYTTRQFTLSASGFGVAAQDFVLPPADTAGGTAVQLSGTVLDASSGAPIENATIELTDGSAQTVTGSAGTYQFPGIPDLSFGIQVSATGYVTRTIPIQVSQFGAYTFDVQLTPTAAASTLQMLSVQPQSATLSGTDTARIIADIGNTGSAAVNTVLSAEISDAKGDVVATVAGRVPGTSEPVQEFAVPASGHIQGEFDWAPEQSPPGAYTITVYTAAPGTVKTRANPLGTILASGTTSVSVSPTRAISGQLAFDPPLVQAGTQNPVGISALIINSGNVPLDSAGFHLTVTDPASGTIVYSADRQAAELPVNNNATVPFGDWLAAVTGNLEVRLVPVTPGVSGEIDGTLYVGNKATAQFNVDRSVVSPGDNTVHAKVSVQGVDVSVASSTDPLFYAVKRSVSHGGTYVGNNAVGWANSHQCLGCHIQTQSMTGLASSIHKATVNMADLEYLINELATSQHNDGSYYDSLPWTAQTQTILGLWSLNRWPDHGSLFRNKLAAAMYIHRRRVTSGNRVWWNLDHNNGWWEHPDGLAALSIKGFADLLAEAPTVDISTVAKYSWGAGLAPSGSVTAGRDVVTGPDGRLYAAQDNGKIAWVDPSTGNAGTVDLRGLPGNANGIAVAADGSFYVSGNGYIAHGVQGRKVTFLWRGAGNISDVTLSPTGALYAVNNNYSQLLRFDGNTPKVVLGSPTLNHPISIAFDPSGNALIANAWDKNLIELAADGTVSVWARGLTAVPLRITYDGLGGWYVISDQKSIDYYGTTYEPRGLYHFTSDGIGERLLDAPNFVGVVVQDGRVTCVDRNHRTLIPLVTHPVDPADLNDLRQDVAGAARYLLSRYRDGNGSRMINALRMIGLGEARRVVTDPTLLDSINHAVSYLDTRLRGFQNSDGGWGNPKSDAIVTALVGLALDYTNPSANDPATRSAIQYLLNSQSGNGSWYSTLGIMSTRLAATSLVMAYMPEALDRLGGLDVDLELSDTPGSAFANLHPAAGSVTTDNAGRSTYRWHLTGVTSAEQDVTFDVELPDMVANEVRPVAGTALLQFKNSFTDEVLTTNLNIPQVKAISGLGVTAGTDRSQYPASADVTINGVVGNNGVPTTNAEVTLRVAAPDGTVIATLPAIAGLQIGTGGQRSYTAHWNTGTYLPGAYTVTASIVDDSGTVADTAMAPFDIVSSNGGSTGGASATLRTSTDRATYNTTDTVNIADLVQSVTDNAILSLTHLHVVVTTPAGEVMQAYDHDLGQLVSGAIRNVSDILALDHAAQGQYGVAATLTDSTGAVIASGRAGFGVVENLGKTLVGTVTAQSASVYQGDPEVCTDSLANTGTLDIAGQSIRDLLVSLSDSTVLTSVEATTTLASGQQAQRVRAVATDSLAVGDYACVLQAQIDGNWSNLGYTNFHVAPPPIKIAADLGLGQHGRVLILTDDPAAYPPDQDPFGPSPVPGLAAQKQHIARMLDAAGWSYTLVTNAADFETQFDTDGYEVYVILSEAVKLPTALQKQVDQAVQDGKGLIVAGNHDDRNNKLEDALGIHTTGKSLDASGLSLDAHSLDQAGGQAGFVVDAEPATVNKISATPVGHFLLRDGGTAPAVFTYGYGGGKAVYMPFDLALEESAAGDNNIFDRLLLDSLTDVHPAKLTPYTGRVLPIVLTVQNEGIPTPGRAMVTVPAGMTVIDPHGAAMDGNTLTWTFDLTSKGEVITLPFWARLPDTTGSVMIQADVQSGVDPDFKDQANAMLLVGVESKPQ